MHPDVEGVTRGKAIALFRSLLEETHFPDMPVISLLSDGVPLVGQEQESPLFAKGPRPMDLGPEQLKAQAALRRRVLQQMKGMTTEEDYKAMKAETAGEVVAGFLSGPYRSEQEVTDLLQSDAWSLSPRFLLRQGEDSKIRIIDDFKMSAVNKALGSSSFLELQDTDYAVGLLRFLSSVLQDRTRLGFNYLMAQGWRGQEPAVRSRCQCIRLQQGGSGHPAHIMIVKFSAIATDF